MNERKLKKEKQEFKIHETQDWIYALKLALPIFIITFYYYYIIENNISLVHLFNKTFALTGVALIVISILIGPLAAFFPSFGKKIGCRKEIGVLGFFLTIIHIIITFFSQAWAFNLTFFTGLIAFFLFLAIIIFAGTKKSLIALGYQKWKFIQRLVYPALFFTLFHILTSGKVIIWQNYFFNPAASNYLPPGTLIITIFICFGFLLRFIVFIKDRLK